MSVLSILEVEGPLPAVVEALQELPPAKGGRRRRAQWAGHVAMVRLGTATGTAFWLEEEELTVVNIHDRLDAGVAESVMRHLDDSLPYEVTSALRFVA
jgi:glucuronate isomerase